MDEVMIGKDLSCWVMSEEVKLGCLCVEWMKG